MPYNSQGRTAVVIIIMMSSVSNDQSSWRLESPVSVLSGSESIVVAVFVLVLFLVVDVAVPEHGLLLLMKQTEH
jgi:hypothetical protein